MLVYLGGHRCQAVLFVHGNIPLFRRNQSTKTSSKEGERCGLRRRALWPKQQTSLAASRSSWPDAMCPLTA